MCVCVRALLVALLVALRGCSGRAAAAAAAAALCTQKLLCGGSCQEQQRGARVRMPTAASPAAAADAGWGGDCRALPALPLTRDKCGGIDNEGGLGATGAGARPYYMDLPWSAAPDYVRYPYVVRGYRCGGTYARCLRSLFELHTETGNSWTMIATFAISLGLLTSTLQAERPTPNHAVAFYAITFSVLLHLPFTVGFHLFRGINATVYNFWRRLDQMFIFIASIFLCFALDYFVFPSWGTSINCSISVLIAIRACTQLWRLKPDFRRNRYRMVLYVSMTVWCYWCPMIYQSVHDIKRAQGWRAPVLTLLTISSVSAGSWCFARGFPECYVPGVFDLIASSHQLMHLGAMAGHIGEFYFILHMYRRSLEDNGTGGASVVGTTTS